ncbi:membrane protein-like protein [Dinothrombium tinctorium]|uniref:Membrane protein-like protein n=1 Tax=Dinothrombium tinctorium TaxID=1965070 RepID=A0A443RN18_9ACAR|nr:membrane protein-like protein [Dinothrombium tinctorium]RWS16642.1 membrane protein-like protein [Dinothrombium tinctorium]
MTAIRYALLWFLLLVSNNAIRAQNVDIESNGGNNHTPSAANGGHTIEGKVSTSTGDSNMPQQWLASTRIIVNYGEYFGFLKRDGSFEISNLQPGSYLVEVTHPDYFYEPIRVDINSKGKIRARKVNYIQTSSVQQLPYPLKFKPKGPFKYFQIRETWKLTDFLFNPMVLMMILPLLLLLVLPKMINAADPETQREMQNMQMPKYDMPELSEMMTSFFTGGSSSKSSQQLALKNKASKKKQ